eukprot:10462667-Ditylum_brightwellii.AAC.1
MALGTFSCSSPDDRSISVTNLVDDHFGLELDDDAAADHKNNDAGEEWSVHIHLISAVDSPPSLTPILTCNIGSLSKMSDDNNDDDLKITMKRMATKWKEQNHHGCCCRRRQRGSSCYGI